jgi:hypothetical protein
MTNDTPPFENKPLALATLLKEALRIERDLTRRLSEHPERKSLLKLHKEYQQLVEDLTWELKRALASYLKKLRAANGPEAGPATAPSARASGAPRPKKKRPPAL